MPIWEYFEIFLDFGQLVLPSKNLSMCYIYHALIPSGYCKESEHLVWHVFLSSLLKCLWLFRTPRQRLGRFCGSLRCWEWRDYKSSDRQLRPQPRHTRPSRNDALLRRFQLFHVWNSILLTLTKNGAKLMTWALQIRVVIGRQLAKSPLFSLVFLISW